MLMLSDARAEESVAATHGAPPVPSAGVVHILSADLADAPLYHPMLTWAETARAERETDDSAYGLAIVSAGLLRHAAAMLTGMPASSADIGHWCRLCRTVGDHGRPVAFDPSGRTIPSVYLSCTRAGETVLVAASAHAPVGIDTVEPDAVPADGLPRHSLCEQEQGFFDRIASDKRDAWWLRTWARKEAVLKATGLGLALAPNLLDVSGGILHSWPRELDGDVSDGVQIVDLDRVPGGQIAAVAFLGPRRPMVVAAHPPQPFYLSTQRSGHRPAMVVTRHASSVMGARLSA
ncbi:MAG: 4'-phosphopantetheinyl transferase superfamily protein [Bifidobacteriaceae bacterium]|jgi:4'-phosphopantetheinyl transferase|nr:4'-phosphopantetheinyl transferase superfamily protein [Bifidobacteriaceae bacterium]